MRHRKSKITLDRKTGPRGLLLRNLAESVLLHERVRTTTAKAKAVRPIVEESITLARTPGLATRRRLLASLRHPKVVAKLLEVLGPKYQTRAGGYTRITKIGQRAGDGAEESVIELV
ncbi:MAG: 50S ribosomal protein L17 [bacterium]|nr:50S ribosomal protein L17 [bacterium]